MIELLYNIIEKSLTFSLIIIILYFIIRSIRKKVTAKCRYILWLLIIIALSIPVGTFPSASLFTIKLPISPKNEVNTNYSPTTVLTADTDTNKISVSDKNEQIQNPQSSVLPRVTNEVNLSNVSNSLTISKEATPYTNSNEINWQLILISISLIWLVGVVLYFLWHTIIYFRYTIKLKKNLIPAGCNAREIFSLVCNQNKITHAPKLRVSNNISSPVLFGFFKSTVIIPDSLENTNALSSILAHELTHFKRRDLWIKLLLLFNESIHWFNPLVHLAAKHCNTEMELSCDEHVLQNYSDDARISYGNMMLNIVKNCHSKHTVLTTHFNPKSNSIKERFENILDNSHKRSGKNIIILILLLCLIANVLIACNIVKQTANYSENGSGSNNEPKTSEVVSESVQTETYEEGYFTPTGGAGNLQIFRSYYGDFSVQFEDVDNLKTTWYTKIGEYPCKTSDAKYLCGGSSYLLIKDDGYYLYNYITKKAKELTIPDGNYGAIHPIYEQNTGEWIGLEISNNFNKFAFYSFEKQSFVTDFSYYNINDVSAHGYICVTLDLGSDEYILDFNSGEILFDFDKNINFRGFLYNDNYIYYNVYNINERSYCLYSEDFKLVTKGYTQIALTDEGYLTFLDKADTHFKCYNDYGVLVKPMNTYKKVLFIEGNYAWVVDSDNFLKLVNVDGDILATFTEWTDNMRFNFSVINYFYYPVCINGLREFHLIIEDYSIPLGTNGRGKDFYYIPKTSKTGMTSKIAVLAIGEN